jgi:type IV pilus assembly protein PilN
MRLKKLQIGIDIQENALLFVIHQPKWGAKKIRTVKVTLPNPVLSDGQLIDPECLQYYLKKFDRRLSMDCEYAIPLETKQTFTQQIPLPVGITIKDYAAVIPAAIQQWFPLPIEQLAFDFNVEHKHLIITAAHKTTIEQWQTLFSQIGLTLIRITIKSNNNLSQSDLFYYAKQSITVDKAPFNLLPWRQIQKRHRQCYLFILSIVSVITLVFIFYLLWCNYTHKLQHASQQLVQLEQQTQIKQQQINNIQQLQQKIADLTTQHRQQLQYQTTLFELRLHLIEIANLVPNGVWLTQLIVTSTLFTLKGQSLTYLSAVQYIEQLCQRPAIATCQLKSLQQKNANEFSFTLELDFKSLNEVTYE